MKILLINPTTDHALSSEASVFPQEASGPYPPLGLLYLQVALEQTQGCYVKVLDAALPGRLSAYLKEKKDEPDLIGITAMTPNLVSVERTISSILLSMNSPKIVIGGPHVDLFPKETLGLQGVDIAIAGEAEKSFSDMVAAIEGGETVESIPGVFTAKSDFENQQIERPFISDLDQLPIPDRSGIGIENYRGLAGKDEIFTTMSTSRGCPYRCTFCSTPRSKYRHRSVDSIMEEMIQCEKLGIKHVYILDDTFPTGPKRLADFCDQMRRRSNGLTWSCRAAAAGLSKSAFEQMKSAGCRRVQIGVETATDEGLKELGKSTTVKQIQETFEAANNVGIETVAYFMIGLPNEKSEKDIRAGVRFAIGLRPTFAMFNILTLYPGTALFDRAVTEDLVDADVWQRFAEKPAKDFKQPVWDRHLSRDQLTGSLVKAYRMFYWRPSILWRQLFSGGGFRGIMKRLSVGLGMLFPTSDKKEKSAP